MLITFDMCDLDYVFAQCESANVLIDILLSLIINLL